jgi:predicted nucleotidyltransferase
MPTSGEKPTSPNLSEVLEELLKAGVDFILVGGLAAVIQGAPVTTMDVDIVHNQSPENIAKLLSFLKSVDAFYRRLDDKLIKPKKDDLAGKGHALFSTRLGPLDILAVIEEGRSYKDLVDHTVKIDFRGHTLRVLDLKMLIQLKRTSTDPKDKQRLPVLKETLRQLEGEYGSERDDYDGNADNE